MNISLSFNVSILIYKGWQKHEQIVLGKHTVASRLMDVIFLDLVTWYMHLLTSSTFVSKLTLLINLSTTPGLAA